MPVYPDVISTVGRTPLIKLNRIANGALATIAVKGEFFNPLGSVKDRIGYAMIAAAEREGILTPKTTIIEPTSGNTGIALAFVAAAKGYKLILTMPESMSVERRTLLALLGAKLVLTPATEGMKGAIKRAEDLHKEIADSWIPQQFDNPANPEDSPADHGRGDLEGHRRQGGHPRFGGRHRRHDHGRQRSDQVAQEGFPVHRRRAERFAGHHADTQRRTAQAGPAQDPRHGRGLCAQEPQPANRG